MYQISFWSYLKHSGEHMHRLAVVFFYFSIDNKLYYLYNTVRGGGKMPSYTRDMLNDREPVYIQIVKRIKGDIISGKLQNGDALPSRRELAISLEINPNTVQKAYKILEDEGMTSTENTAKSLVSVSEEKIKTIKTELALESALSFIEAMKEMNIDEKEAAELLHSIWRDKE